MREDFSAPWSRQLKVMTAIVLLIVPIVWLFSGKNPALMAAGIIGFSALFCVRGYTLRDGVLLVRRLIWSTRFDLRNLQSADLDPSAMARSWRVFGIGGLFGYVGWYRNARLGNYSAFVTEPRNAVVLRFSGRNVVISPANPEKLVGLLRAPP